MLLSMLHNYKFGGRSSAIFKPSNDDRYSDNRIETHYGTGRAGYRIDKSKSRRIYSLALELASLKPDNTEGFLAPSVFGIDEAQFFEPSGIIWAIEKMMSGRYEFPIQPIVIVNGLSQDSYGKPFGAMPHLLAIADEIIHLKAVCAADKRVNVATRTYRKDSSNTNQVAIGGAEMYEPRCFDCWKE